MKVKVTVVYPITVEIDLDVKRAVDDPIDHEYLLEKREEAKTIADGLFPFSSLDPVIHDCDIPVLIE